MTRFDDDGSFPRRANPANPAIAAGLALAAAGVLALPAAAGAQEADEATLQVEITEWEVPWADTRPRDPDVAPDGRVWFVGQRGDYLAVLDPGTGVFERVELPEGAGPHNLIVAEDGTVWYAGNRAAHIGSLAPGADELGRIDLESPHGRDPHTLVFGADGDIWFTVQGGNAVGRLGSDGQVRLWPIATERARPYGIIVAGDGRPWFTLFGTNKLGTIDPATMELREIVLPREDARARRLVETSDGAIWYVDYAGGRLGRLDPASGEVREWDAPAGDGSRPYAMAVDGADRVWFVETGVSPNRLVGFDTAAGAYVARAAIPSGGGAVRHMIFDPASGAIWFGTDANTIGRALIP